LQWREDRKIVEDEDRQVRPGGMGPCCNMRESELESGRCASEKRICGDDWSGEGRDSRANVEY
jgi:hypothetical protein